MQPVTKRIYLRRPRIEREFNNMSSYPLTILQAAMGFGKSSSIQAYMAAREYSPIYIPLSGSCGSIAYFWERLTSLIEKRNASLGSRLKNLGLPMDMAQLAKIVNLISDTRFDTPVWVILDDYQFIDEADTANLLTAIVAENIPNLHIILLTRSIRALPVTELLSKGLCHIISQDTLRFRKPEINQYFRLQDMEVSGENTDKIFQWTGGWITGIYLLSQRLKNGEMTLSNEPLEVLLENNFYKTYSPEVQNLLEECSFLDSFTSEQAVCITGNTEAPAILRGLLTSNALIVLHEESSHYQITDIFKAFLQKKAESKGCATAQLYLRMAEWFIGHGNQFRAYNYFYLAGDHDRILRDLDSDQDLDIGAIQYHMIKEILEEITQDKEFTYPLAMLRYLRASLLWSHDLVQTKKLIVQKLGTMECYFKQGALPVPRKSRILGEIHNTWIFCAFNDPYEIVEHAKKAVGYFNGRYSCIVSNRTEFTYGAPSMLYTYYTTPGRLTADASFISENYAWLERAVQYCGHGYRNLIQAELSLETGDFDAVRLPARKSIIESRMYNQLSIEICAVFALARHALISREPVKARQLMQELMDNRGLEEQPVLNTTAELCHAYISLLTGRTDEVPVWLKNTDNAQTNLIFDGIGFTYIVAGRLLMMEQDDIRLEIMCQEYQRRFDIHSCQFGYIFNDIYCSVAKYRLYGREEGISTLKKALDIASQDAVFMPFIENAAFISEYLKDALEAGSYPEDYKNKLLSLCSSQLKAGPSQAPGTLLTDREKEVLSLLAQGLKHGEMAEQLCVSVPTVRYHIQNIYKKLSVNNRTNAIAKAKETGLLT
ncbi:LuxR C-terminal-related transcriptional regulator [Lachnoclostridium pacaense]|uniref:helix-turn-helix transcriptional regulator n=1 Tax=Enterocloster hominis (ex Hitch et al. 2024) TaxID=1917870 RepID=UPI001D12CBEF|nr:LuxR C-terminal-related transcriptional regulator [Lachnoclostridium pacaense]MCC2878193.1 LuxR C-terminal-related transcriptional regulator [Lachnoclostridium pacaense]